MNIYKNFSFDSDFVDYKTSNHISMGDCACDCGDGPCDCRITSSQNTSIGDCNPIKNYGDCDCVCSDCDCGDFIC